MNTNVTVALVTGGAPGLARATGRRPADSGDRMVVVDLASADGKTDVTHEDQVGEPLPEEATASIVVNPMLTGENIRLGRGLRMATR